MGVLGLISAIVSCFAAGLLATEVVFSATMFSLVMGFTWVFAAR